MLFSPSYYLYEASSKLNLQFKVLGCKVSRGRVYKIDTHLVLVTCHRLVHGACMMIEHDVSHETPESQSQPRIAMVYPEPCFKNYPGGYPRQFITRGSSLSLHLSGSFEQVAHLVSSPPKFPTNRAYLGTFPRLTLRLIQGSSFFSHARHG